MRPLRMLSLVLAPFLSACATEQAVSAPPGHGLVFIPAVPFFSPVHDDCAATSLASVLAFSGTVREVGAIEQDLVEEQASLPLDLALYPRQFGFLTAFGRG